MNKARLLDPPDEVKGMVQLNRDLFSKRISIVVVTVDGKMVSSVTKCLKKYMLCMKNLKNIRLKEDGRRCFLLNPDIYFDVAVTKDQFEKADFASKVSLL